MRTLRIVLVAVAVCCAVAVAVGGYRLAGTADAPSLGSAVVVEPATTTSTRPAEPVTTTTSRAPAPTAAVGHDHAMVDRRRGRGARVERPGPVVGWMVLLVGLALAVSVALTWRVLLARVDERVNAEIAHEADKLRTFAASATDQQGQPYTRVDDLLERYLARPSRRPRTRRSSASSPDGRPTAASARRRPGSIPTAAGGHRRRPRPQPGRLRRRRRRRPGQLAAGRSRPGPDPARATDGGADQLLRPDPPRRDTTVLVTDELDRMSRIVDDLIVLAKAEQPDFLALGPVDVADLTVEVAAKARALGRRQWTVAEVAETVILADGQRLTQALLQLAANAVQHTGDGDRIAIGSTTSGGRVRLWVSDTGPGIAPEDHERIFERFARGSEPRRSDGAGLGLTIVRTIVQAHGGVVRVDSAPGQGATFTLELPAHAPVSPAASQQRAGRTAG